MLKTVSRYIARHNLLNKDSRYLVAVSGGADSVALLVILKDSGYDVEVAHCNFHLRGAESDRDETFVRQLCEKLSVPFHIVHFDTRGYAELHKVSIEMAARTLRYSWFEQLKNDIGASAVCVAHHRDDNVETVMMNMLRGTGLRGMTGIKPVNGNIVRPLLCVSRQQIVDYLDSIGQDYVNDSTNFVDDALRNKIRLNILPLCNDVNPSASEAINQTSGRLASAEALLDFFVAKAIDGIVKHSHSGDNRISINIANLFTYPSAEYILFEILKDYGFTSPQIEAIYEYISESSSDSLAKNTIGKIFSSAGYDLLVDRDCLIIEPHYVPAKPVRISVDGVYVYGDKRFKVALKQKDENFIISKSADVVMLDADKVKMPLTIRNYKEGERFIPFGMKGSKLISDYLTDRKKTLFEKRRQLVIADADDNILWLVNERPDNRWRITDATTSILEISWRR